MLLMGFSITAGGNKLFWTMPEKEGSASRVSLGSNLPLPATCDEKSLGNAGKSGRRGVAAG